jgi:hypothetical protein
MSNQFRKSKVLNLQSQILRKLSQNSAENVVRSMSLINTNFAENVEQEEMLNEK